MTTPPTVTAAEPAYEPHAPPAVSMTTRHRRGPPPPWRGCHSVGTPAPEVRGDPRKPGPAPEGGPSVGRRARYGQAYPAPDGEMIRIVTDSSCDLPDDAIARHHIEVIPLTVRFGEEELLDREELTPEEFWRRRTTGK